MAKRKKLLSGINTVDELLERDNINHLVNTWLEHYGLKAQSVMVIWVDEDDTVRMATSCVESNVVTLGMLSAATNLVFTGRVVDEETIEQDEDHYGRT